MVPSPTPLNSRFTQVVPQQRWELGQVGEQAPPGPASTPPVTHTPPMQFWAEVQAMPQPPQWRLLVAVFTQEAPQQVVPASQALVHIAGPESR